MASRKCPVCGTPVNPENLPRHLQSVHPRQATSEMVREAKAQEATVREPRVRSRSLRTLPSWRVPAAILVIFVLIGGVYFVATQSSSPYNSSTPVTEMCMQEGNFARHDHATLTITILGSARTIPDEIGITPSCMRPLHTHVGQPNQIHIESSVPHEFTVGDFFIVWSEKGGQPFSQSQIMGNNADATHEIVMTVDGVVNSAYQNYAFPHGTEPTISISYQNR